MLDRLAALEENIQTLEELRVGTPASRRDWWALRYGLLESIQIVIDVACELVATQNLGTPKTYRQCIELLVDAGILESPLADRLVSMVGLRNLLVHEYDEIDEAKLLAALGGLDDFTLFAQAVARRGE